MKMEKFSSPKREHTILLVFGCLLLIVGVGGYFAGKQHAGARTDEPKSAAVPEKYGEDDPPFTVKASEQAQAIAGIQTSVLQTAGRGIEAAAIGTVVDLDTFWDFGSRYAAAVGELTSDQAAAVAAEAELRRIGALFADNKNASQRALESARAAAVAESAKVRVAQASVLALETAGRQQFGSVLTQWVMQSHAAHLAGLRAQRQTLVRVASDSPPDIPLHARVLIAPGRFAPATFISTAPQVDSSIQGRVLYYLVDAALPVNARVDIFLPHAGKVGQLVAIPGSAIVWYGGQPWIYLQIGDVSFERRSIPADYPNADGFLVDKKMFAVKARIVVRGAQLLLSDEMAGSRGPSEPGDDDDD